MAVSSYLTTFNNLYPASTTGTTFSWSLSNARCNICHFSGGGSDLNEYGRAFRDQHNSGLSTAAAFQAIEALNSDQSSLNNIGEINANAQPGWRPGPTNSIYDLFGLPGDSPTRTGQNPPSTLIGAADPLVNQPPVMAAIPNQTVNENSLLSLSVSATDDGPPSALTFALGNQPTGATLTNNGNGTATFNWTPNFTQAGNYSVNVTVTDGGGLSNTQSFNITVNNVNRAPALDAIGNQTVNEGQSLTFTATASDPDGNALTFTGSNLPTGASVSATGAFSWTPSFTQAGNYPNVTITVTDNGSPALSATRSFNITVGNTDRPPVLSPSPIGSRNVNEGELLEIALSATDPDSDPLTFTGANLPTGATVTDNNNGTATFSWTPDFTQAGNYPNVTLTVSDGTLTDSEIFTISVGDVNRPPVLSPSPIGDRTLTVGQTLTIQIAASDPDGGALTFSNANLPTGATLTPTGPGAATFSWTPSATQTGTFPNLTLTVTDTGGLSDSESFNVTVGTAANRPPVLNPIGNQTATENQLLTFTVNASDPDGDALTFSATNPLPTGATLIDNNNGTATFNWTPDFTQAGNYDVTITVSDGALTDSEQITITVGNVNRPPVLNPIGNQTATENQLLTFTVNASDPDGGTLTFTATSLLPSGATLTDNNNGTATFNWTPNFAQAGNYSVTITVSDGSLTDQETITITVGDVNRAPTVNNPGNKTVTEGQSLSFTITGSDPDGGSLTFSATGLPAGATLAPLGGFSWTPTTGQASATPYSVTVTATDNGIPPLTSAAVTFTVTVNAPAGPNQAPTVNNPGDKTVTEGQVLSFTITGTDPDGDALTFSATGLPTGATLTPQGGFTWTPTTGQAGATPYSVTVTAIDNGTPALTSAPETFAITVNPPVTPTGSVRIKEAEWEHSNLEVKGRVKPGRVTIIDADTGMTLGTVMADREGEFEAKFRLTAPPCRVQATAAGNVSSAVVAVEGACRSQRRTRDD